MLVVRVSPPWSRSGVHRLHLPRRSLALAASVLALSTEARADDGGATRVDGELARLVQSAEELGASACPDACRALSAMTRSASRLCELDSGEPCARARAVVADARTKVEARCGACPEPLADEAPGATPKSAPAQRQEATSLASERPPEERRRGSCAACSVGSRGDDATPRWAVVSLAAALWIAHARRRRRDQCTR